MRGTALALVALTFAATPPHPAAAQCYGPECDRRQFGPPQDFNDHPNFPSSPPQAQPYRSRPFEQAPPYGPAPYEQRQPYQPGPQSQPNYRQPPYQQPTYQQPNYHQPPYQQPPDQQPAYQQRTYQRPAYQAQPQPPMPYSNVPPGVAPRVHDYRPARPNSRIEVRTQAPKISKPKKFVVRQHQPAPTSRVIARTAPPGPGSGQVTISVAEYRDLQRQARELQRLRSTRSVAPHRVSPFPDVRPPAAGIPPRPPTVPPG